MLGSLGLWSSSKGMVLVPNLSGLTNTQAEAAIISAGLTYSGSSSTTTSNIALSNQVVSQLPNANELVPYGSDVSFIYYNYAATTTTTTTTTSGGGGGGGTPPPPVTTSAPVATISNLTYTKTGTTTGTLSWSGSNINNYLYTGNSSLYPSPYNYGAYTATWPGNLVNLVEGSSYTVTITVINSAGAGNSQTITFTHPVVTTTTTTSSTTTTTTVSPIPTLPTPVIQTYAGWQVYPGSVYATFNVMNFDYDATYTSSLGVRNPEFPEEWIVENLTPNQSYTVNITVSKPGYTSATGSATFIANPANNPTTTTTTSTVAPTTTTTTSTVAPTTTTTTTTAAPGAFTISSISSTTNSITYSWSNPPAGTAFYTVQYSDNDVIYTPETTGSTSKTFTNLAPNTLHTVFVTAKSSSNGYLADANASISTQAVSAPTTTTTTTTAGSTPVPSGGSVSLSGGSTPGSLITASTSGWSGSPTSYSVIITTSTSGTPTANDTVVASGIGNSASYTITSNDAVSPVNRFRAFATATNASGTSAQVASGTISATPSATTTTTTAAPTYSRNEVRSTSAGQCPSLNGNYTVTYSNSNYTGEISAVFTSCVGVTTTTTVAPTTTTTTASAATTTTGLDCSGNTCDPARSYTGTKSVSTSVCASGTMNTYTCWTPGTCQNVTTDTGCVAPGATTTTTTAAAEVYRLCTSFNVANGDCSSQGCSSGGCGSGSVCTSGVNFRCLGAV